MEPNWPGISAEFISDAEFSDHEEFLKYDELCESDLNSKMPATATSSKHALLPKNQQLTMEAFSTLADRSKLAEARKTRNLFSDPRRPEGTRT